MIYTCKRITINLSFSFIDLFFFFLRRTSLGNLKRIQARRKFFGQSLFLHFSLSLFALRKNGRYAVKVFDVAISVFGELLRVMLNGMSERTSIYIKNNLWSNIFYLNCIKLFNFLFFIFFCICFDGSDSG